MDPQGGAAVVRKPRPFPSFPPPRTKSALHNMYGPITSNKFATELPCTPFPQIILLGPCVTVDPGKLFERSIIYYMVRSNPIFPMGKCVFSHFSHGKKVKKVYGKRGKSIRFPRFAYTFFPMGKKWGWTPPPIIYYHVE